MRLPGGIGKDTITIPKTESVTEVKIKVTAQNGINSRIYTLAIREKSNDTSILNVIVNGKTAEKTQEGNYIAKVTDNITEAVIVIKANDALSTIDLARINSDNTETNVGVSIARPELIVTEEISQKETIYKITVTAEDGTTKSYTLTLEKAIRLTSVKVEGEEISNINNTYNARIDVVATTANIEITANIENTKIEIIKTTVEGEEVIARDEGILKGNIALEENPQNYKIRITSENGSQTEEYTLILTKKSTDNTLKEVWVDEEIIEPDVDDGNYYVELENAKVVQVKGITTNEYATIRINYDEEIIHEAESSINASKSSTRVTLTVTSETGATEKYYLYIKVLSRNTDLDKVIVDEIEITDYNKNTETYTAIVDNIKNSYPIFLMAQDNGATVELYDGEEIIASGVGSVSDTITLENEEEHDYRIKVSLDEEHYSEYTLKIGKLSNNTRLKLVEVNDAVVKPTIKDKNVYEVEIPKLAETAKIRVESESSYAMVQIGDYEAVRNGTTVELKINVEDNKITVPVVVTAADGTKIDTYNILLIRQPDEKYLDSVVVNGEELENINDVYTYYLKNGEDNAHIEITALENSNANIEVEGHKGTGYLEFDEEVQEATIKIEKKIKVTSEDGKETEEYTLIITRKTQIIGKITTENYLGKYISKVKLYRRRRKEEEYEDEDEDEYGYDDDENILITEIDTEEDGSYVLDIDEVGIYDVLVTKSGYLDYKVAQIEIKPGAIVEIEEYKLIAGDVAEDGEIEINDLVDMNRNVGRPITDDNREEKAIYDLNEDGKIDKADRNILKENYGKRAEEVIWVNPEKEIELMSLDDVTIGDVDQKVQTFRLENDNTQDIAASVEANIAHISEETSFILPMVCEYRISSEYGYRIHPITGERKLHSGMDIVGEHHTEILSVADGVVVYAGTINGYGNCIEIKHVVNGETIYSFYAHLSKIEVKVGDKVSKGTVIGLQGGGSTDDNPGNSTGEHLHFELRTASGSGHSIDPRKYIEF